MVASSDVHRIGSVDKGRALSTLQMAFANDPILRWEYPDPFAYVTNFASVADAFGGRAFDAGTALGVAGMTGVALWLPPGLDPDVATLTTRMKASISAAQHADLDSVIDQMEAFHPAGDIWYLPLMGVDLIAQGRGLGTALLRHSLAMIDTAGGPAYLEATSERSRALYERFGFEAMGRIQAGSSPPMWPMFRLAHSPRAGQ